MDEHHKIVVIKSKTFTCAHGCHRAVTHVHASVLWKIVHFSFSFEVAMAKMISNSTEPVVPKYPILWNKNASKWVVFSTFLKQTISLPPVTNGLDMASFDNETHFYFFPVEFDQTRVFLKTTCSPTDPPSDLQNVKNSPWPTHFQSVPKMGSKPTHVIRDENIQSTATTCSFLLHFLPFFSFLFFCVPFSFFSLFHFFDFHLFGLSLFVLSLSFFSEFPITL